MIGSLELLRASAYSDNMLGRIVEVGLLGPPTITNCIPLLL